MVTILVLASIVAVGCSNGTYPVDIFYEMHYQQSYGPHEPPRLSAPAGAVPITGVQISTGENPFEASPTVLHAGESIFASNCVFCHGAQGKGGWPGTADHERPVQLWDRCTTVHHHPKLDGSICGAASGCRPLRVGHQRRDGYGHPSKSCFLWMKDGRWSTTSGLVLSRVMPTAPDLWSWPGDICRPAHLR